MWAKRQGTGLSAVLLLTAISVCAQNVNGEFKIKCVADEHGRCITSPPHLRLNQQVSLLVEHVLESGFDDSANPNPHDLVLFLDGRALASTHPTVGPSTTDKDDVTTTLLTYRITRDLSTAEARKNWKEVLTGDKTGKEMTISTGLENGPAVPSDGKIVLVVMSTGRLVWYAIAAILGALAFFMIAYRTGALRDKEPPGAEIDKPTDRAFSLSRVQMALWTILAIYAYLFIWILTGEYNATIPASAVGLMGISLGTFGVAAAIDAGAVQAGREKLKKLKASGDKIPKAEEQELENQTSVAPSEGFFSDILTSAEGASLHRVQFALWTVALAVVFVTTVWKTLAIPDFDVSLLGLMGITSGAYVALKVPEKKR